MSNETKREVFETIADKCAGYDDGLHNQYLKQYDAATDGETEAQRTCPYCHKPHRAIPADDEFGLGGEPENFLRIGMTGGDVWNGIPPKLTPGGAIHTVTPVGYDNAEVDETISINYCPMCGRRLEAEK